MIISPAFSISHDDSGFRSDWFLDKVIIDCPSLGKSWTFPCNRWLAKGKDDGKIERELFPQNLETEEYTPCKNHTCITVQYCDVHVNTKISFLRCAAMFFSPNR